MQDKFIEALRTNNLKVLGEIPKGDLHNHITRGGNRRYIEKWAGISIPNCASFRSLDEMNQWYSEYIKPALPGKEGYEKRVEASFVQAKNDGIKVLHMSVGIDEVVFYDNSFEQLIAAIKRIHRTHTPDIHFVPEIALNTFASVTETMEKVEELFEYKYFKSIDIYGDEYEIPKFKKVYRRAKMEGLMLKAHVGEYSEAEQIIRVVEELELDQVQHGISAAESNEVMKWLQENKIQLNLCPTSNIVLGRAESYKNHPIGKLFRNGVKVTINTDDMIIFDQSVSEEFLNIFNAGCLNAEELNEIRENSL